MTYKTRKSNSIDTLGHALIFVAVIGLAALVLHQFVALLDRPEVRVSYVTGKCVEVVDHKARAESRKSEWSCNRLPKYYEHVWVY